MELPIESKKRRERDSNPRMELSIELHTPMELPYDCIKSILIELPTLFLQKLKDISRIYNSIISDPYFIQMHNATHMNSNSQNLYIQHNRSPYSINRYSLVRFNGRDFKTETVLDKRDVEWEEKHLLWEKRKFVLCAADGLILISEVTRVENKPMDEMNQVLQKIILQNPCTRQHKIFKIPHGLFDLLNLFGMCRVPTNNDFKVVLGCGKFYTVFSCKNNFWSTKKFEEPLTYDDDEEFSKGISIDGAIYWVWRSRSWNHRRTGVYIYEIIYFDSRDDEIKFLKKPYEIKGQFTLTSLKGCLCLHYNCPNKGTTTVWKKEKDGLFKVLFKVDILPDYYYPVLYPFAENKFVFDFSERFCVYDISARTFEEFKESEIEGELFPCQESFYFPAIPKEIGHRDPQSRTLVRFYIID